MIDHIHKKYPNDYKDYENSKKIHEITDKQLAKKGRQQLTLLKTQARVK